MLRKVIFRFEDNFSFIFIQFWVKVSAPPSVAVLQN